MVEQVVNADAQNPPAEPAPADEGRVDLVDRIGNRIVGSGLLAVAAFWLAGAFGVPFLLEIATVASVVLGVRMARGSFGASGFYGTAMVVLSLTAAILFLFMPVIGFGLRIGYGAWLVGGALGKFLDLW